MSANIGSGADAANIGGSRHGVYVDKSSELEAALESTFQTKGPSLLVIPIDYRENNLLTERLGNIVCPI